MDHALPRTESVPTGKVRGHLGNRIVRGADHHDLGLLGGSRGVLHVEELGRGKMTRDPFPRTGPSCSGHHAVPASLQQHGESRGHSAGRDDGDGGRVGRSVLRGCVRSGSFVIGYRTSRV